MINFCLFVFVLHAVRDSAQEIVFGKQKKSAVYAKKRRMREYEKRKKLRIRKPRRVSAALIFV
ncbi:hypothetical protein [Ruminococcus sp.]|uniref:hypothetical protein n=1 Tax=Ruminococcus sp. TaxID=41978 RepID=UPI002E75F42B|nr:hypothetical protein [Ruminococcus sp.]MEE1263675.1 hypothetical protein [Ruminococcus sp.]